MTGTSPSLSIIIPTYNRTELVVHAVRSALDALPDGGEIIVTDDRSDPPASEALADLSHPALRVTVNTGARGAAANRNHAAGQAAGDVLLFLDDDDLMLPDYPGRILTAARTAPQSNWGFSATRAHDASVTAPPPPTGKGAQDFRPLAGAPMRRRMAGLGCGFWIRRATFDAIGGIDEDMTVNEDTDLSLKLLTRGHEPLFSAQPGVSLLRHGRASLTRGTDLAERMRCFRTLLDRYAGFLATDPRGHRFLLRRYLKVTAKHGALRPGLRAALTEGPPAARAGNLAFFLGNLALYLPRRR